jgi:hypothetical protein
MFVLCLFNMTVEPSAVSTCWEGEERRGCWSDIQNVTISSIARRFLSFRGEEIQSPCDVASNNNITNFISLSIQ